MNHDEKTLADILHDVWRAKFAIVFFALLGLALALLWVAFATPYYKATMIVSPANPMNGSEIAPVSGDDFYALRYLVQRMGVSNSSDFQDFENIFDGPTVAATLIKDSRIIAGLKQDRPFAFFRERDDWTPEDVAEYFSRHIKVEAVGTSPLRRLVYHHPNREFAVYVLGRLHEIADTLIRERIQMETSARIQYLNDAIDKTLNPENRRALTALLLEQERLRMLVSINQSYAATILEPPSAGTRADWPDAAFLVSVFVLVGAFTGFIIYGLGRR